MERRTVKDRWRAEVRSGQATGVDAVRRVVFGGSDVGEDWWTAVLDGRE